MLRSVQRARCLANVSATPSTSTRATAATFDESLNIAKDMCALTMWMRVCRLFWPTRKGRPKIDSATERSLLGGQAAGLTAPDCIACNPWG